MKECLEFLLRNPWCRGVIPHAFTGGGVAHAEFMIGDVSPEEIERRA